MNSLVIIQNFYIFQVLLAGFQLNFEKAELKQPISLSFCLAMLSLIIIGYLTQSGLTRSAMLKKASYIMPFGYSSVIFGFLMDKIIYA